MNPRYTIIILVAIVLIGTGVALWNDHKERAGYEAELLSSGETVNDEIIKNSLLTSNFAQANFGGQTFIAYEKVGQDVIGSRTTIYLWLVAQEFYEKNGRIQKGSGMSIPLALYFKNNEQVAIVAPRDGSDYSEDINKIFPEQVRALPLFSDQSVKSEIVTRLSNSTEAQAQMHFGKSLNSAPEPEPTNTASSTATSTQPVPETVSTTSEIASSTDTRL